MSRNAFLPVGRISMDMGGVLVTYVTDTEHDLPVWLEDLMWEGGIKIVEAELVETE